jgi:hypothetical protein
MKAGRKERRGYGRESGRLFIIAEYSRSRIARSGKWWDAMQLDDPVECSPIYSLPSNKSGVAEFFLRNPRTLFVQHTIFALNLVDKLPTLLLSSCNRDLTCAFVGKIDPGCFF